MSTSPMLPPEQPAPGPYDKGLAPTPDVGGKHAQRPWLRFYPPGVGAEIPPVAYTSIPDMVRSTAKRFGPATAFSHRGVRLTFTEVDELSDHFAAYLQQELGLAEGDRIVLQMPNLLQYPVALFGALKAGLIVVNANPLYTPVELAKLVADARPRAIVVLANFAGKVAEILPGSGIEHVIVTQVGDLCGRLKRVVANTMVAKVRRLVPPYEIPAAVGFRTALDRGRRHRLTEPALGHQDVAFLQYTGGTTGGTKAAVLTHLNLLANQEQFLGQLQARFGSEHLTVIAALPLYHVFALTVNGLGLFRFGAHNVLITDPTDTAGLVKTLATTRPDAILLVNTLARALLDTPSFTGLDFTNLKIAVAAGAAVHAAVASRWHEVTGLPITEGYGLTEASPVVSLNPVHLEPRVGSIGVPLPSTDVRILDADGQPVPAGQPGELAVKGPQVMRGYWNRPLETAEVLTSDGWLLTGDIAVSDDDGFLQIVDRKKELIIVSGFNVYPNEIEEAAVSHPKVAEAGAVGVPDAKSGEVPKLVVVARDASLTEAELREHLKSRLTGYKRPRYIEFRDALPKSNVGKVLRRELKDT
ncbi:long-chain-fatty-acid--CoA ligase FadD [Streptomyces albidochromogenes]|uniref:AMP-binding protein n=1 Tax=Streptomyces albidochromogenes TaxID=329524 RepID=UPI001ABF1AB3|nr:AMP-binding protein [Streptomyces albidochromogenes]